jgi:hypothetical protein
MFSKGNPVLADEMVTAALYLVALRHNVNRHMCLQAASGLQF